jgi:hypothetical protein
MTEVMGFDCEAYRVKKQLHVTALLRLYRDVSYDT